MFPNIELIRRPRLSELSYTGSKKISRLPARSAIIAFSSENVYSIAELVHRLSGGAAVVLVVCIYIFNVAASAIYIFTC